MSRQVVARYRPSPLAQACLLEQWDNRCAYCQLPFGLFVWRRGHVGRVDERGYYNARGFAGIALRLEWDHFVPLAYTESNADAEFLPACHLCNGLKASSIFRTIHGARESIEPRWLSRYELASGPVVSWAEAARLEAFDYQGLGA